ncbi:Na(+)/H(+) exchange regulatory cofactor NHE-RF4-like isoform X3 [Brienomyrus brachyistius]|uniref:Na(+)/H(+) exchange regulatory cofactor NHE-RF4-like isoform X3 n=1 Tax=Brienomyrus brachyistius TaxID=42636 RepID=UPI0020B2C56E|nr:Na(+)/H(+) exchange regulatory cofactor NHE-RF4-like isoform X3 [Brienomyrus brachyistius]
MSSAFNGPTDTMDLPQKFTFNPKEGIDNPALVISEDAEPDPGPAPRLCVLKRAPNESFGFHLRLETGCRGHIVQNVEPWSVAEYRGLQDGDRLLAVNGEFVGEASHHRVTQKIQVCGTQLCLLVLSGSDYEQVVSEGRDLRHLTRAHLGEGCARPRLCHITRDPRSGLGLSITPIQGKKGPYSVKVARGGAAERSGVREGDWLLWINGTRTSELAYSALRNMMKKCGIHVTVLVIDTESERAFVRCRHPILPSMAVTHNLPHRPSTLHLEQGPGGYGFLLREEKMRSGRLSHVLRDIDAGSPAEAAGMRDGDTLLAVNAEPVEALEHEEIVLRVRRSGQRVALTTIRPKGADFYFKLGLSPLLFCDDILPEEEPEDCAPAPPAAPPDEPLVQAPAHLPCPRLCVLERGGSGFGFHLGGIPPDPGTFISQVAAGGPGEKVGLFEGDVVVEVNGMNVEEEYLEDVVALVKKGGESLKMLVVERWGYELLKKSGMPIRPGVITQSTQREETPKRSFF